MLSTDGKEPGEREAKDEETFPEEVTGGDGRFPRRGTRGTGPPFSKAGEKESSGQLPRGLQVWCGGEAALGLAPFVTEKGGQACAWGGEGGPWRHEGVKKLP